MKPATAPAWRALWYPAYLRLTVESARAYSVDMDTEKPITKAQLIREALLRRYPCAEIPYGTLTAMGKEFGATRELVRQQARKLGFGNMSMAMLRSVTVCACGKEMSPGSHGLCSDCRKVELPCGWCGKLKKVSAASIAWRIARGNVVKTPDGRLAGYTGQVFCGRSCFGNWLGSKHGRGAQRRKAGLPSASEAEHGTTTRYNGHCRCRPCKDAHNLMARDYQRGKRSPRVPRVPKHGTVSEYKNYGCHCDPCGAAGSAYYKARRLRRAARDV